ncbi:MAG: hypothetical protein RLZZ40_481 [Actinomycetota bacterium]|jgi:hypothetical protein
MATSSRIFIAFVLQLVATLFALTSWTDPLEGGLAMVIAIILSGIGFAVGRVRLPKFTWISALGAFAFLALFWGLYISEIPVDPRAQFDYQPSDSIRALLSAHMYVAIVFVCAIIFYAIVEFTAYRASKTGDK